MVDVILFIEYLLWGLAGALAHVIVMKLGWDERTYVLRELGLAVVLAFVFSQMRLPNSVSVFGLCFLGVDAIEAFLRRLVGGGRGNRIRMFRV